MKEKVIKGDVRFDPTADYSSVEEITGDLYCSGADTSASFPKLTTVGGDLDCSGADTSASFPKLTTVGGYLDCSGADTRALFPKLTTVGGDLYCSGADTSASFPKLTTVGGDLYCRGADTRASFPQLTTVGGHLYCSGADTRASFPQLTTVGGTLYCRGAGTSASFPKLPTVGGTLYCSGADTSASFPQLKKTEVGSATAQTSVERAFRRKGFLFTDGILARLEKARELKDGTRVHRVVVVGKTQTSYCIEVDGTYSHGETMKEARESLLYKIGERDKSKYEGWELDRKITKREAIESYRVITGACESGVRHFVETQGKLKRRYTVREVIEITRGQYGNEEYAKFFA